MFVFFKLISKGSSPNYPTVWSHYQFPRPTVLHSAIIFFGYYREQIICLHIACVAYSLNICLYCTQLSINRRGEYQSAYIQTLKRSEILNVLSSVTRKSLTKKSVQNCYKWSTIFEWKERCYWMVETAWNHCFGQVKLILFLQVISVFLNRISL